MNYNYNTKIIAAITLSRLGDDVYAKGKNTAQTRFKAVNTPA